MHYLNPKLDIPALSAAFKAQGRLLIRDFFTAEVADALARNLYGHPWTLQYRDGQGDNHVEMSALEALSEAERNGLTQQIIAKAQTDFQFSFYAYSATQAAKDGEEHLLARFVRYMASEDFLAPMRELTGKADLRTVYAQATMYGPGSFLLIHNDEVGKEQRRVAYVINLTRNWRADWGGLLHFVDEPGSVIPCFPCRSHISFLTLHLSHKAREPQLRAG
jgi:SM-20-related protein